MDYLKEYRKQLLLTIIILIGLIAAVYLVQTKQIFRSKASQEIYNTFQLNQTTPEGEIKQVSCENTQDGYTCTTESLEVNLKVDIDELEKISQEQ